MLKYFVALLTNPCSSKAQLELSFCVMPSAIFSNDHNVQWLGHLRWRCYAMFYVICEFYSKWHSLQYSKHGTAAAFKSLMHGGRGGTYVTN